MNRYLEKYEVDPANSCDRIISIRCEPNFLEKLFRIKQKINVYIGSCTVWYKQHPNGNLSRCDIFYDGWLLAIWKREERKRKLEERELSDE